MGADHVRRRHPRHHRIVVLHLHTAALDELILMVMVVPTALVIVIVIAISSIYSENLHCHVPFSKAFIYLFSSWLEHSFL